MVSKRRLTAYTWIVLLVVVSALIVATATSRTHHNPSSKVPVPDLDWPRTLDPYWQQVDRSRIPLLYYQGITHDRNGDFYFAGIWSGLYRTDPKLRETERNRSAIPRAARRDGYNHIGDISWDRRDHGRLILPLGCFAGKNRGKRSEPPCRRAALGVASPRTLRWQYKVDLDPRYIQSINWAEASPEGRYIWTSSGDDLIAYRAADVRPTNRRRLKPVRRLNSAKPDTGITGATFMGRRLLVAGARGNFQISSIDLSDGSSEPVIEKGAIVGESEGLDVKGRSLYWQIAPYDPEGRKPTYGRGHVELLRFLLKRPKGRTRGSRR